MNRNLSPSQKRILLGRGIVGVVLTSLAIILLAAGITGIGIIYKNPLVSDNTDCALKSGFGLFLVATFIEVFLLIMECISLFTTNITHECCKCEHYHLRFILHFTSATMVIIGAIIYGVEDKGRVGWSFWMAFSASVLSIINGVLWCMTMQMRRFLAKGGGTAVGGDAGLGGGIGGNIGLDNMGGGLGGNLGGLDTNLGGNLGGNALGIDLGNAGLDSNLGGGTLNNTLDLNPSGNLGNLEIEAPSGDLLNVGLGSDSVLTDELKSAPLGDPVLTEELKAAPNLNTGTEANQMLKIDAVSSQDKAVDVIGGFDSGPGILGLDMPLPQLPVSVDLDVGLAQSVNTSGLDISEDVPKSGLNSEQLDFISELNI